MGPAVTSTRREASGFGCSRVRCIKSAISSGSAMRPVPVAPQASWPEAGSMMFTPVERRYDTLRCTAGCSHICVFMAGATNSGLPLNDSSSVLSASSPMPDASLPIMLAVAGATTMASPQSLREMCSVEWSLAGENRSEYSLLPDTVSNVSGVTNSSAWLVATHCTSCPAFTSSLASNGAL